MRLPNLNGQIRRHLIDLLTQPSTYITLSLLPICSLSQSLCNDEISIRFLLAKLARTSLPRSLHTRDNSLSS